MNAPGLHIGAHVLTPDGWGYIRTSPIGDMQAVHLDSGEVANYFTAQLRPETFWEFLTKRPGNVGAWSAGEFIIVQSFIAGLIITSSFDFLVTGWVALLLALGIESVIMYGMHENWKGRSA